MEKIRYDFDHCQRWLDYQPSNSNLQAHDKALSEALLVALRIEEEALRQKS